MALEPPDNTASGGSMGSVTGSGTAQQVPVWITATSLGNSSFADKLTVAGSATATLVDAGGAIEGQPAFVAGSAVGEALLVISPTGTNSSVAVLEADSFGGNPVYLKFGAARGSPDAPTSILNGDGLFYWTAAGYTGSGYFNGMTFQVTASSDFSGTPTSSIDLVNASGLGWHVVEDGSFSTDGAATSPAVTVVAAAVQPDGAQVGTLTNMPTAGNPTLLQISQNGTLYAVPGWPI